MTELIRETPKPRVIAGATGDWEMVIGLEVHAQVASAAKLFSGASTAFGAEPNSNVAAQEKLTTINAWYAGEIAWLAKRLAETPEPDGSGSLLDHTTIIWTNELGEGNSHSRDDIPWVFLGDGLGFAMGRAADAGGVHHNRLLLALAHAMGHTTLERFGNPDFCAGGPLTGLA